MKKKRKELEKTTNSKVYKINKRKASLSCTYCAPNSGCNSKNSGKQRSWKNYRNTQWK